MATGDARFSQGRLEPRGKGGLAAALRKHMSASLPRFDEKKRKYMKEPPFLKSSMRPCMADKEVAKIIKLGTFLVEDYFPTDGMFSHSRLPYFLSLPSTLHDLICAGFLNDTAKPASPSRLFHHHLPR